MAQALVSGIKGARYELIPSAAHQANIEQATLFNANLETFLVNPA
jgi:hypothetical protein